MIQALLRAESKVNEQLVAVADDDLLNVVVVTLTAGIVRRPVTRKFLGVMID